MFLINKPMDTHNLLLVHQVSLSIHDILSLVPHLMGLCMILPMNSNHAFRFLEVKCPYSYKDRTPKEACEDSKFCCKFDPSTAQLRLKESHNYFSQVQGQMGRPWCDFVVYTKQGISVQRIKFDKQFWDELVPKLESFYNNCVVPEIVSPLHPLGLPLRNLSKT